MPPRGGQLSDPMPAVEKDRDTRTPKAMSNEWVFMVPFFFLISCKSRRAFWDEKARMTTRGHQCTLNSLYYQKPQAGWPALPGKENEYTWERNRGKIILLHVTRGLSIFMHLGPLKYRNHKNIRQ